MHDNSKVNWYESEGWIDWVLGCDILGVNMMVTTLLKYIKFLLYIHGSKYCAPSKTIIHYVLNQGISSSFREKVSTIILIKNRVFVVAWSFVWKCLFVYVKNKLLPINRRRVIRCANNAVFCSVSHFSICDSFIFFLAEMIQSYT